MEYMQEGLGLQDDMNGSCKQIDDDNDNDNQLLDIMEGETNTLLKYQGQVTPGMQSGISSFTRPLSVEELELQYLYTSFAPIEYNPMNGSKIVLVTGGTGFIAAHIVERLLARGYRVRATVRNKSLEDSYKILNSFPHSSDNLEIFQCDLLEYEGWEDAINGCEIVIHCASPYKMDFKDPYEIINPAIKGVNNVMEASCSNTCVKKIVLTSSIAAVIGFYEHLKVYSEADWNHDAKPTADPYLYSKAASEKIAARIVDERRPDIQFIVVNPGMVIGPSYRDDINQSVEFLYDMLSGKLGVLPDLQSGWIDVRDVAELHIRLFETNTNIDGRYICVEGMYSLQDIARYIKKSVPSYRIASTVVPSFLVKLLLPYFTTKGTASFLKTSIGKRILISNGKLLTTFPDYIFIPIEKSVCDTCNDLLKRYKIENSMFRLVL